VLSHVTDVFQVQDGFGFYGGQGVGDQGEILYRDQSKWFNQSSGDGRKEATLGLTWANQVNTRVMLGRTQRHPTDPREEDDDDDDLSPRDTPIRRFSLIFGPSASPTATDFIVVAAGVQAFNSLPFPSVQPRCGVPAPTTNLSWA